MEVSSMTATNSRKELLDEKVPFERIAVNNEIKISDIIMEKYSISHLRDYFGIQFQNEYLVLDKDDNACFRNLSQAHQVFPIQCMRHSRDQYYTVYQVLEGGFYYIFWDTPANKFDEPSVYFAAYFFKIPEAREFDVLKAGVSTADDVHQIDANFYLSFLMSSGIRSYSLLKDGTIMKIEYNRVEELEKRSDLLFKGGKIIKRETSIFAAILSKDLDDLLVLS